MIYRWSSCVVVEYEQNFILQMERYSTIAPFIQKAIVWCHRWWHMDDSKVKLTLTWIASVKSYYQLTTNSFPAILLMFAFYFTLYFSGILGWFYSQCDLHARKMDEKSCKSEWTKITLRRLQITSITYYSNDIVKIQMGGILIEGHFMFCQLCDQFNISWTICHYVM